MSGVEAMIRSMEKHLGMGEPNFVQKWYRDRNGAAYGGNFPWCNAYVTWAAVNSGNHAAVCLGTDYAYTVAHAAKFRAKGQWHVGASGIRRGDIVFFDWGGTNDLSRIDHVGVVTGVSGANVYTIEGNISNRVARKVRSKSNIAGYGRPKYKAATSTGTAPKKLQAFPGLSFFKGKPNSPIVTAMGKRLVAKDCSAYQSGPGPQWTNADKASYSNWQKKYSAAKHLGWSGEDVNGWPGKTSWDALKVPQS